MEYKQYNDYELLYMVKEKDEISQKILFEKYQPILRSLAKEYYYAYSGYGYAYEDFLQEANIAFQKAICYYDESQKSLFYSFALLCVRRNLITFCRDISLKKRVIADYVIGEEEEYMVEDKKTNMNEILDYSILEEICKKAIFTLPMSISSVLELKLNGFSYREIGKLLSLPTSTVASRFSRAKKYLQQKGVLEKT